MKQLEQLLAREQVEANAFMEILKKEADILSSGAEPDALADITQEKWYRANALNTLYLERQTLLTTLGADVSMETLAHTSEAIAQAWATLKPCFEQARDLNASNGMMIEHLKKNTDDAMAVLRSARGQSAMYTAKGRQASSTGRVLAKS
jgi:flagella synthesis protein FlgN